MNSVWLIVALVVGGLLSVAIGGRRAGVVALITLAACALMLVWLFVTAGAHSPSGWWTEVDRAWIPRLGIRIHFAIDGLSALMLALTIVLGAMAVLASWQEIRRRQGFFYACTLWTLAGVVGVFTAIDLVLFYLFWELMLVPMYFLIGGWGGADGVRAGVKFFIFTQLSGLLMLVAIIGLAIVHARHTGVVSFDYLDLLGTRTGGAAATWLMLGFFVAFLTKMPVMPLHPWFRDAYVASPTGGSILLAGLLSKTGAYGLLRFALPLFPGASHTFALVALLLAVASIFYGAVVAFAQSDLKRLVTYSSLAHMGFVLLGIYAFTPLAAQGVVLLLICHGLTIGGLFFVIGSLERRGHTRDLNALGGLWRVVPRMGAVAMILALASLGLPGLGNFVAELFVLVGTFAHHPALAAVAAAGLVPAVVYALRLVQGPFFGPLAMGERTSDLRATELVATGGAILLLVWLGLYPQPIFHAAAPVVHRLLTPLGALARQLP